MEGVRAPAARWGTFVARHRWAVVAVWAALFVASAFVASGATRLLSPASFSADTEATRAADLLRREFPDRRDPVLTVVFQSGAAPLDDPAYRAQVAAWRTDLERLAATSGGTVSDPLPGRDGRTTALIVSSNQPPDRFIDLGGRAARIAHRGPARVYVGGPAALYDSFVTDSEQDLQRSEAVSLPLALLLLLLVFGGLVAGLLPVATGAAAVTVAVAALALVARLHTVSLFALNVSSVIGLGLGIDYSLLVVNRFREEIGRGLGVEEAVGAAVATAGVATAVSGGTVAIGFGALLLSHLNILWSMGLGGAAVVAASVLASLTLIPALLAIAGRRVDSLALPFVRGSRGGEARFWHGLARRVMARPLLFLGLGLAAVLVLAAPARALRLGVSGVESLPPGDQAAQALRIGQAELGFPAHSAVVALASGVGSPAVAAEVEARLRQAADGQPVRAAGHHGGFAAFEIQQPGDDNAASTGRWLDGIRAAALPPGVRVRLTGTAASYQDFLAVLTGDVPVIVGAVLALTFVLLGLAFRSLALPLKAVLMNLLSVAAALGVLTWAFQEGHLAGLLDFRSLGFVDATVPVLIFSALFGLSMDYEVFLLSRVREEWAAGRPNAGAVAAGMERTGRIITSAALILVVVVGTLAFGHLTLDRSIGLTFAAAILLDATLIRLLLVPATMRLLGALNWWPSRAA